LRLQDFDVLEYLAVDGSENATRVVRNPSQEQAVVSRGGKGKQVEHEVKISNPVHVSEFEDRHGTTGIAQSAQRLAAGWTTQGSTIR